MVVRSCSERRAPCRAKQPTARSWREVRWESEARSVIGVEDRPSASCDHLIVAAADIVCACDEAAALELSRHAYSTPVLLMRPALLSFRSDSAGSIVKFCVGRRLVGGQAATGLNACAVIGSFALGRTAVA